MKAGIITVSDKGFAGKREDVSGKVMKNIIKSMLDVESIEYAIVPDEVKKISAKLREFADKKHCHLILTTGGTGFTSRDVTPEATLKVIERMVPGIPETIRQKTLRKTPFAMLSRAVAGIRGKSFIINFPGSPKAVKECLEVIEHVLGHALELLDKGSLECANIQKH